MESFNRSVSEGDSQIVFNLRPLCFLAVAPLVAREYICGISILAKIFWVSTLLFR